ncbi:helix-turn-helix domain-containing protein [Actinomadura kijaniata]|uniref:helix-turn-helix domain-containing protein n=1 Tax=Actinomadura kijaniata TaxID=46161 RepID=UPI001FE03D9B
MSMSEDTVVRNRALQAEWYGEPLGDRFRRLLDRLGLSQSGLAGVLGLSAPMLSQLMSGQRAKISNPVVLNRLLAVEELAADPAFDSLSAAEVRERLGIIRARTTATTSGLRESPVEAELRERLEAASPARVLQALLREVASANEIEAAADLVDVQFPEIATLLRVYGNGRASEAEAHLEAHLSRTLGR